MTALRPGDGVRTKGGRVQGVVTELVDADGAEMVEVLWSGGSEAREYAAEDLERTDFHGTLKAGDSWNGWTLDEVDMTAELMKVRVFDGEPGLWIDVRLFGLQSYLVQTAAASRKKWLEADRQKLDWFKPGQIVKNKPGATALARPATVVKQDQPATVQVITSNGLADVPFGLVELQAASVNELLAKEAQKRDDLLANFKNEVREKAMEAAEEHGWCSEVKEVLSDLGIKTKVAKVRAVLHLTVEVEVEIAERNAMERLDLERASNLDWWGNTLKFEDDGKDLSLKDDDDLNMGSMEVRLISSRVDEIHDESYLED